MAEKNEETPENLQEEVEQAATDAPEAAAEETPAAEEPVAEGDEAGTVPASADSADESQTADAVADSSVAAETKPKAAPKSGPTRREKLEAKRTERQAARGKRKPRTPEERDAERRERRAAVAKQRRAYRQRTKTKRAEARKAAPAREPDHAPEHGPGRAKVRQGVVVSEKGDKTITVAIDMVRRHKRYHKIMRSTIKLYAHDERNDAHEGDTVRVQECRPMSRSKRWRLVEVLERAK
jgi:small subunit ribosomal protein S17